MASHVVQMSTQATAVIPFTVAKNDTPYPDYADLVNSPYLDVNGKYVQLGASSTVKLENYYISFGDLNGDVVDDAAVLVKRFANDGSVSYAIAAMLNQGGILFNIADYPLGNTFPTINSHEIVQGGNFVLNTQLPGEPAVTSTYQLVGNQWMKLN